MEVPLEPCLQTNRGQLAWEHLALVPTLEPAIATLAPLALVQLALEQLALVFPVEAMMVEATVVEAMVHLALADQPTMEPMAFRQLAQEAREEARELAREVALATLTMMMMTALQVATPKAPPLPERQPAMQVPQIQAAMLFSGSAWASPPYWGYVLLCTACCYRCV